MTTLIILDTTVLGFASRPLGVPGFSDWFQSADREATIIVPSVCDYELRREFIRAELSQSVARLDQLLKAHRYEDMDPDRWHIAARLWAAARNRGRPTADLKSLDIDVLVAAIAVSLESEGEVVVATSNVRHLAQFVDARLWSEIAFPGGG